MQASHVHPHQTQSTWMRICAMDEARKRPDTDCCYEVGNRNAVSNIICCSREISLHWDDSSELSPRKAVPGRKPEMYVNVQYQRNEEICPE